MTQMDNFLHTTTPVNRTKSTGGVGGMEVGGGAGGIADEDAN